jgi:hypothetical protein
MEGNTIETKSNQGVDSTIDWKEEMKKDMSLNGIILEI